MLQIGNLIFCDLIQHKVSCYFIVFAQHTKLSMPVLPDFSQFVTVLLPFQHNSSISGWPNVNMNSEKPCLSYPSVGQNLHSS